MGLLGEIIDGATDDSVSTVNLLRKALTIAARVGAEQLATWARLEMNGYQSGTPVPAYRGPLPTQVTGRWVGPFQSQVTDVLSRAGVPDNMADAFQVTFRDPLATLEALSAEDGKHELAWDPWQVITYDQLAKSGKVPHPDGFNLWSAGQGIPRAALRGIIDTVRNKLLDMALELESAAPEAGSRGGPTVAEEPVAKAVSQIVVNIYGAGASVAVGGEVHQTVNQGDLEGLLGAARNLGLDNIALGDLEEAVTSDEQERPSKVKAMVTKVASGGYRLAGTVAAGAAGDLLAGLVSSYLGMPSAS